MTGPIAPPANWKANFFPMWAGQAISLTGSHVAQFALIWWLTTETGSATVLATASIVGLLPGIVLGPVAGAYVDRWNRRRVMIAADTAVALASLLLAYLYWSESVQIWHIYIIMFVRSLGGSFHWPAFQASTSLMVPQKHMTRVAGLGQTLNGVLTVTAPPLGALLLAALPMHEVMLVDVGTAAVAVLPLFLIAVPQPAIPDGPRPHILADLRQGLAYVTGWRGLMALLAAALVIKLALTPAMALLPLLVSDHFQGGASRLALLEAVAGIGMITGGLLLSTWGGFGRRIHTTLMGIVILGLGLLALGLAPADMFALALAGALVLGLAIPLVDGPIMAIMQVAVEPAVQGRVFMLFGSLLSLSSPVGLLVAGPVSDRINIQFWLLVAASLCLVGGLILFFVPALVNIEENRAVAMAPVPPADVEPLP